MRGAGDESMRLEALGKKRKKNKTAGALWFVNVAAVLGKQQAGEKKINQKGELQGSCRL